MANGRAVAGEGTSAADGNAAGSCEYTGTLSLEQVPDDGGYAMIGKLPSEADEGDRDRD